MHNQRGPSDFDVLLSELDRIERSGGGVPEVRALLLALRGRRIRIRKTAVMRDHAVRVVSRKLGLGATRAQICLSLQQTLQCSESTARRLVNQALDARRPAAPVIRDLFSDETYA